MTERTRDQVFTFECKDARVVEIRRVDDDKMMRTLLVDAYGNHFPARYRGDLMAHDKAVDEWNRDPIINKTGGKKSDDADYSGGEAALGTMEDDVLDVEAFLGAVMLDELRDYNALKQDMYERHKRALGIHANVVIRYEVDGQSRSAIVYGVWPSLSRSVPLTIRGKLVTDQTDNEQQFAVVDARQGDIRIGEMRQLTGSDFFTLLRENGGFSAADAKIYLGKVFGQAVAHVANAPAQIAEQVMAGATLSLENLKDRIETVLPASTRNKMLMAPFVALGLRACLMNTQLVFINEYYGGSVQLEAMARGPRFINALYEVLNTQPEILCLPKLRREYAKEKAVHGLSVLPDLPFDNYMRLETLLQRDGVDAVPIAIDIYHNILRRDVFGYASWWEGRMRQGSDTCYTTGHMFTVLGAAMADYEAQYYPAIAGGAHDLRDPSTLSSQGRFAVPWTDHSVKAEAIDFAELAQAVPANIRQALANDYGRLKRPESKSLVALLRGLYWLAHHKVVVMERFIGTGPNNNGLLVDAIFLADIHEAQGQLRDCLRSIVLNGREQHRVRGGVDELTDARLVAVRERVMECESKWRREYPSAAARSQFSAPDFQYEQACLADLRAEAVPRGDRPPEDPEQTTLFTLARTIARDIDELQQMYRGVAELEQGHDCDLYAGIRNADGRPYRCWPLQRTARYATHVGKQRSSLLALEQIEALERVVREPIVQISGAGGVGKSEIIVQICAQYPPEQVMCLGFTGKVASDLEARSGHKASTIHSAMFRHLRYMQTKFRVAAYRKKIKTERKGGGEVSAERFTTAHVAACRELSEIRAYVEHHLGAYTPQESPFEHVRVLIIDEDSLLSFPLFVRLLEMAHCPERGRFLEKLVLLGDIDQLPPIDYGCVLSDLAHGLPSSVSQLVINHRSSGGALFALARGIATHRPDFDTLLPTFQRGPALVQLSGPTAQIVSLSSTAATVGYDTEVVLDNLGVDDAESEAAAGIQFIASTNKTVDAMNLAVRKCYHVEKAMRTFTAELEDRNRRGALQVVASARAKKAQNIDVEAKVEEEREKMNRSINMRIMVGDRFFVKKNQRRTFKPTKRSPEYREVAFYNGRLLRVVCFYDAPKRLTASLHCRCGLCPVVMDEETGKRLDGECMERLDLVPPLRCGPATDHNLRYHDQGIESVNRHDNKRRMLVAIDEQGSFVELDVRAQLAPRSRFEFGFAMTVHKLQGSQAHTIVYVCVEDSPFVHWKAVYTALTRARERLIILGDDETFDRCVRRKAPLRRSSLWLHLRQAFDPDNTTTLGQWPQPLISREQEAPLWYEFEDLRLSVAAREADAQREHKTRLEQAAQTGGVNKKRRVQE